jgi:hypothetical protein
MKTAKFAAQYPLLGQVVNEFIAGETPVLLLFITAS